MVIRAYLYLLLAVLLYAGNILVGKAVAGTLPPVTLALGRVLVALIAVVCLFGPAAYRQRQLLIQQWRGLLAVAVSGVALFNVFVYAALQYTSATNVAVLESGVPVITALCMAAFFGERLRGSQWLGIVLSVAGAAWVVSAGQLSALLEQANRGDVLMLLAVCAWVGYSFTIRRWLVGMPAYATLVPLMAIAALILAPMALAENLLSERVWSLDTEAFLALLYLGLGPSLVAFVAYNRAVLLVGPSRSAVLLNLLPLVTMAGGFWWLGAPITLVQIIGAVVVVVGVTLVVFERR
ncbi:DMT family transporter [Pseudomonas sp. gcc21]|uniref:DMT family transporter n=1 Tax=Pseudomonas sp. gcc21 TaxID=2726989 RepID=UPI00273FFE44|nr:DMT family transporter [Pseudomonas sp. gcc21]